MSIAIEVFIVIIENLFFYIGIKNCKHLNGTLKNMSLISGIIVIAYITMPIKYSIFRYVIVIALFQALFKFIYKEEYHIYDIFLIAFNMLIKFGLEFLIFGIALNGKVTIIYVCVAFSMLNILQAMIRPIHVKLYALMVSLWNDKNKFYYRYLLLIMTNGLILFIMHNLIKIKGVM